MARSPKTRAEIIADPTIPYSPPLHEIEAAMGSDGSFRLTEQQKLRNDLNCIAQRATAMINHFAPGVRDITKNLRWLIDEVEMLKDVDDEANIKKVAELLKAQLPKYDELADRLATRANEVSTIAERNAQVIEIS